MKMINFDLPALKQGFLSEYKVQPLAKYFLDQINKSIRQSPTNDYSFVPDQEFMSLLVNDSNRKQINNLLEKYDFTLVRLHCRPEMSVTDTHYDGGYTPTFGVCLSGKKLWSVKKVTYWDLLTLHYGAISKQSAHHTLDSMLLDRSIWFHDNPENQIVQNAGELIYLPPGWYHTVLYSEDVISFSITLKLKDNKLKLRGMPASFYYSPPLKSEYQGSAMQWAFVAVVHHLLHTMNHLLRVVMFPIWTLLGAFVAMVRCKNAVGRFIRRLKPRKHNKKPMDMPNNGGELRPRDRVIYHSLMKFIEKSSDTPSYGTDNQSNKLKQEV
jgi:hypothetical protein